MEYEIRNKIERFKIKAEGFLKENIKAFIIDINNTYYFCDILFVGDTYLEVQNFKGVREGEKEMLFWADIVKLEDYKERENDMPKM
jgi:CRISPR/Cas system CMR-associated protein Cmr1 (group 7 of RAMP superfamily)